LSSPVESQVNCWLAPLWQGQITTGVPGSVPPPHTSTHWSGASADVKALGVPAPCTPLSDAVATAVGAVWGAAAAVAGGGGAVTSEQAAARAVAAANAATLGGERMGPPSRDV
jgi:hypothetical protein